MSTRSFLWLILFTLIVFSSANESDDEDDTLDDGSGQESDEISNHLQAINHQKNITDKPLVHHYLGHDEIFNNHLRYTSTPLYTRSVARSVYAYTSVKPQYTHGFQSYYDNEHVPNIRVYPDTQDINEGQEVVIRCRDEGYTRLPVKWSRSDNKPLPYGTTDVNGRLTIPHIKMDEGGLFICSPLDTRFLHFGKQSEVKVFSALSNIHYPPDDDDHNDHDKDQSSSSNMNSCPENKVMCRNGRCIRLECLCDGVNDCGDFSDEEDCKTECSPEEHECSPVSYIYGLKHKCIPRNKMCDNFADCPRKDDELKCIKTASLRQPCAGQFACANGKCINKRFQCDNETDCPDKSDEFNCKAPIIVESPRIPVRKIEKGGKLILTCRATGTPIPVISWQHEAMDIYEDHNRKFTTNEGYGVLTISSVSSNDVGKWTCIASNNVDSTKSSHDVTVELKYGRFPQVMVSPINPTGYIGGSIRLQCQASGNPTPQISWHYPKDISKVDFDIGSRSLILRNLTELHRGRYTCRAFNDIGSNESSVYLTINSSYRDEVTIEPPYVTVTEGEVTELTCRIPDNSMTSHYEWLFNDGPIPEGTYMVKNRLTIYARPSHSGVYRCIVDGKYSEAHVNVMSLSGSEVRIEVTPEQQRVQVGSTAIFTCNGNFDSLRWYYKNQALPLGVQEAGNRLIITQVDYMHEGEYTCEAYTPRGTRTSSAKLIVDQPSSLSMHPIYYDAPEIKIIPESQTAIQGTNAQLKCSVRGVEFPQIRWSKFNEELSSRHKISHDTLTIENVIVKDRGMYICEIEDLSRPLKAYAHFEVETREPPVIEIYPEARQMIKEGESAYFQCRELGGVPIPKISWNRREGQFSKNVQISENTLRFNYATSNDNGVYICTAENIAGSKTLEATLMVMPVVSARIKQPNPLRVREGEQIVIDCYVSGVSGDIQWKQVNPSTKVETVIQTGPTLNIENAAPFNSGEYICFSADHNSKVEDKIYVEVISRSEMYNEDSNKELVVTLYSPLELSCEEGKNGNVLWLKNYASLPHHVQDLRDRLYISSVSMEDAGVYTCRTFDSQGLQAVKNTHVRVIDDVMRINIVPPSQHVYPGQEVKANCFAESASIRWIREHDNVVISNNSMLVFPSISKNDEGRYICIAKGYRGNEARGITEIKLVDQTQSQPYQQQHRPLGLQMEALLGSRVPLRCEFPNYPNAQIQWTFNGQNLPSDIIELDPLNLIIPRVQEHHDGRYICNAFSSGNIVARDFIDLSVSVDNHNRYQQQYNPYSYSYSVMCSPMEYQCPDRCIDKRRVCDRVNDCHDGSDEKNCNYITMKIIPNKQSIYFGDDLILHCTVEGSDPVAFNWEKINGDLSAENIKINNNVLSISGVKSENKGIYRCHARTSDSEQSTDYGLAIQAPQSQDGPKLRVSAKTGQTVELPCEHQLSNSVVYTWIQNNNPVEPKTHIVGNKLVIPDAKISDAGLYECIVRNANYTFSVYIHLDINTAIPKFDHSYMKLSDSFDLPQEFNIEISLKPEASEGLIFHGGERNNFLALGLRNGYLMLHADTIGTPLTLKSVNPLTLYEWNVLTISKSKSEISLDVNGNKSHIKGYFDNMFSLTPLYIGGTQSYYYLNPSIDYTSGFVGCISIFKIHGTLIDLMEKAQSFDISACDVCSGHQCKYGSCSDALETEGYKCICNTHAYGKYCENIREECAPGVCGTGRCVHNQEGRFDCYCPFGYTGLRCEQPIEIQMPSFEENAYAAYEMPSSQRPDYLKVALRLKPRSLNNGLIFYGGENKRGDGDFVALSINNKSLELMFNSGSGTATIRSPNEIELGSWVDLIATTENNKGFITVDDRLVAEGEAPGPTRGTLINTPIYIGSADKAEIELPSDLQVRHGFDGCIAHMEINASPINIVNAIVDSGNVQDCTSSHDLCLNEPCLNDGICQTIDKNNYFCACKAGFSGDRCENRDLVMSTSPECNIPCKNDGTCKKGPKGDHCCCKIDYSGQYCERKEWIGKSIHFEGDGYVSLDGKNSNGQKTLEFNLQTNQTDGVILYYGKAKQSSNLMDDTMNEYLIIIKDGKLQFLWLKNHQEISKIKSKIVISDGHFHDISIRFSRTQLQVTIDKVKSTFGTALKNDDTSGQIFIGGLPEYKFNTHSYYDGLIGCIKDIKLNGEYVDLRSMGIDICNIHSCS